MIDQVSTDRQPTAGLSTLSTEILRLSDNIDLKIEEIKQFKKDADENATGKGKNFYYAGTTALSAYKDAEKLIKILSTAEDRFSKEIANASTKKGGFLNQAYKFFREAIEHFTDNSSLARAHAQKGIVHTKSLNKDRYIMALKEFDTALELDAQNVIALSEKGKVYLLLKKSDEALPLFKTASRLDMVDHSLPFYAGQCLERLEDYNQAKIFYGEAERRFFLKPHNPAILEQIKHGQNRVQKLLKTTMPIPMPKPKLEAGSAVNPPLSAQDFTKMAHRNQAAVARELVVKGEYARALEIFEHLTHLDFDLDYPLEAGKCHEKLGQLDEALKCYSFARARAEKSAGKNGVLLNIVHHAIESVQSKIEILKTQKAREEEKSQFSNIAFSQNENDILELPAIEPAEFSARGEDLLGVYDGEDSLSRARYWFKKGDIVNAQIEYKNSYNQGKAPDCTLKRYFDAAERGPAHARALIQEACSYKAGQLNKVMACFIEAAEHDPLNKSIAADLQSLEGAAARLKSDPEKSFSVSVEVANILQRHTVPQSAVATTPQKILPPVAVVKPVAQQHVENPPPPVFIQKSLGGSSIKKIKPSGFTNEFRPLGSSPQASEASKENGNGHRHCSVQQATVTQTRKDPVEIMSLIKAFNEDNKNYALAAQIAHEYAIIGDHEREVTFVEKAFLLMKPQIAAKSIEDAYFNGSDFEPNENIFS